MKFRTIILVVIGVGLVVTLARPAAKLYVANEVGKAASSTLAMNSFSVNPLTGTLLVGKVQIEPDALRISPTLGTRHLSSAMTVETVWAQCNLHDVLHRKLQFPVAVLDGVSVEVQKEDIGHVPDILLSTNDSMVVPQANAEGFNKALLEMEKSFESKLQYLGLQRAELEKLDRQVAEMEAQLNRVDNPLRGREAALQAESRLSVIERTVGDIQSLIEKATETCRREVETLQQSNSSERLALLDKSTEEIAGAEFDQAARSALERLLSHFFHDLRPSLALSVRFVEELVTLGNTERKSASMRGVDYEFRNDPSSPLACDTARIRGVMKLDSQNLAFTAKMRNIGQSGYTDEERPSFDLNAQLAEGTVKNSLQQAEIHVALSPDRRGFRMQSKAIATGPIEFASAEGMISSTMQLQNPRLNLSWLMHQNEWTFDLVLDVDQARVNTALRGNAGEIPFDAQATEFEAVTPSTLVKATIRGSVVDGRFESRFIGFDSPAEKPIAVALSKQYQSLMAQLQQDQVKQFKQDWKRVLSQQTLQWESIRQQASQLVTRLQSRTGKCRSEVIALLEPNTDLRFSRGDSSSSVR